ncbi:MAG: Zn-ribbon domain-containing OB-fold protein [Halioglobus sp.]
MQPRESELSAPYWQGAREGVLKMQRCDACAQFQFYPRTLCSHCGHEQLSWEPVSGTGTVLSFTIVRRGISKAYDAPYIVALIALTEGVTMMSSVQTSAPESVMIGAKVKVVFEEWGENVQMPVFKLV